nr:hypothetical protein [uncultured Rhodopila sp.]
MKESGYHSSICTTYSVDGAFYEGAIQRRLRTQNCLNNILIADASMLGEALRCLPRSFQMAGRRYAVVPAHVQGCFHPKVLLRLGTNRARLQIMSANATTAGWCRNLEVHSDLLWEEGADDPDNETHRQLIRKAYDYLLHWLEPLAGDVIAAKLRVYMTQARWLFDIDPNPGPVSLADGTAVDLLLERGDGTGSGILNQLVACVSGDHIRRIVVASPYWDTGASALLDLQDAFDGIPLVIAVNPNSSEFPQGVDLSKRPISFATDKVLLDDRFAHAKLFVLEGDAADHVVSGSANASRAALGSLNGIRARNAEATVYRRLPRGTVLPSLGLSLAQKVEQSVLRKPNPPSYINGAQRLAAGTVELDGSLITWWPPSGVSARGATMLAPLGEFAVRAKGNGQGAVDLPKPPDLPLIVRFRLADGRETVPVIVHDYDLLHANSITSYGSMTLKVRRYERGDIDLIDLAAEADSLFALPDRPFGLGGGGDRDHKEPDHEFEFEDEAAFRKATELPRSPGRFGPVGTEDVVHALMSRITMGFHLGMVNPAAERERERLENEDDDAGENEDDLPPPDDDSPKPSPPKSDNQNLPDGVFTPKQVARRRRHVIRMMKVADADLDKRGRDPSLIVEDVPAKAAFVISVLNMASRLQHCLPDGSRAVLMPLLPDGNDRDNCVLVVSVSCRPPTDLAPREGYFGQPAGSGLMSTIVWLVDIISFDRGT